MDNPVIAGVVGILRGARKQAVANFDLTQCQQFDVPHSSDMSYGLGHTIQKP